MIQKKVVNRPAIFTVPRYIQIAERLISKIESGELPAGTRLAPERELSCELNINRMTLRRALKVLESQGLLEKKHGVGNFIAYPKIDRQMQSIFRFTSGMTERGYTPGTKLISIEVTETNQKLANEFGKPVSKQVFNILRLRSINQEPVMLESYKIPVNRFPKLDTFDLEKRSVYEIFASEYDTEIARSRQSLEPILATTYEADLLNIGGGDPLMLEKRLSYDADDNLIEYGEDRYRGDRFRFVAESLPMGI